MSILGWHDLYGWNLNSAEGQGTNPHAAKNPGITSDSPETERAFCWPEALAII